jgi:hypothetical protein
MFTNTYIMCIKEPCTNTVSITCWYKILATAPHEGIDPCDPRMQTAGIDSYTSTPSSARTMFSKHRFVVPSEYKEGFTRRSG